MGEGSSTAATVPGHLTPNRQPTRRPELTMSSFATPVDVLYANELMRGRLWVAASVLLGIGGIACAMLVEAPGDEARALLAAGCTILVGSSGFGLWLLRDDGRYSARLAAVYGYTSLVSALPALHFFGWFSPIVLVVALGGVIFSMGHTNRAVVLMCMAMVGSHGALALATIFGAVPDRGIAAVRVEGTFAELTCVWVCEALIVVAFVIGRRLRGHMLLGVESYGDVVRENARREALLEEAVEELRRVRRVGDPGRYSGLQLGSFELGVVLGRGGMGEVYEATRIDTGEPAAVKVMMSSSNAEERALRRFEREIALAASVESPHVVRVLEHSQPGADVLYLAMERLTGASLAEELRSVRRPPQRDMLAMLRQVALGVSAAHGRGVVHRDLTPHNVFHHQQGNRDVWKILDFGVSRLAGAERTLTGNAVVGTPNYMSPEQASGREVDARTDLFSIGCVAYRCLTGRPAFRTGAVADVLYRVVHEMPIQPSSLVPMPLEVDLVFAVALAKEPDDRFRTAEELVDALERACRATIDRDLREHATRLLAAAPWGEPPSPG